MNHLKNRSVINLVKKAIRAGNKNPSIQQLSTLATALGDLEAQSFLRRASTKELSQVKTCIAVVNGSAPERVSDQIGNYFGLDGKETEIKSEGQDKMYSVEKSEKTTDDQKSITERKKVTMEEKHPETSDRKTDKGSVSEPLKEKVDPKIKKILERGKKSMKVSSNSKNKIITAGYYENELSSVLPIGIYPAKMQLRSENGSSKWLDINEESLSALDSIKDQLLPKEETNASKKIAREEDSYEEGDVSDENDTDENDTNENEGDEESTIATCSVDSCVNYDEDKKGNCALNEVLINWDDKKKAYCSNYEKQKQDNNENEDNEEDIDLFASRIQKGENPKSVLSSFVSFITGKKESTKKTVSRNKKAAEVQPGESVQIKDETGNPVNVTVDSVSPMAGSSDQALIGRTETGESVVVPGGTEVVQTTEMTV
jgi:hypothetical protein